MKNSLYNKLAISTIKRHKNLYLPFAINAIFLLVITTICLNFKTDPSLEILGRYSFIKSISGLAYYVMLIFSTIIIFSTYNFIQKKKFEENGMYMVLGMEKRHIIKIMIFEIVYIALLVSIVGTLLGFVLYKLALAIYINMINLDIDIFENGIFQSPISNIKVLLIFLLIFLLLILINIFKMRKLSPIEFLTESKAGEKKSKFTLLNAAFGLLALIAGYYISLTTKNPLSAISNLFIAVVLVIIGTYLSFTVIISFILNRLKSNKNFYYKKNNFAAVSGLMYRVINSSRVLSAITILSTSVMVILTSGFALYFGIDDKIEQAIPSDYIISNNKLDKNETEKIDSIINQSLEENKLSGEKNKFTLYSTIAYKENDEILGIPKDKEMNNLVKNLDDYVSINLIYKEDTKELFKNDKILQIKENDKEKDLIIKNNNEKIGKINYKDLNFKISKAGDYIQTYNLLTNDYESFDKIKKLIEPKDQVSYYKYDYNIMLDKKNKSENWENFDQKLSEKFKNNNIKAEIISKTHERKEEVNFNSSIFFVGILLGTAFLFSTVMFIYYKQLSEGYDDIERFRIMRQVGMTDIEAKKTVSKQIGVVFMLPILFTIMHISFAVPILNQFLKTAGLLSLEIMILSMILSLLLFFIFYLVTFNLTKKVYMNLILENNDN